MQSINVSIINLAKKIDCKSNHAEYFNLSYLFFIFIYLLCYSNKMSLLGELLSSVSTYLKGNHLPSLC